MQDLLARGRSELRHEPIERRVRADDVVDSTRAILVWEPRRVVPSYAVPGEDIAAELTPAPAANGEHPGVLHPGVPFAVHTAPGEPVSIGDREGAGFRLADQDLAGYVALDFGAFERWLEEDEPILGHPIDPYHRVDVRRTSRPVRIEVDGEVVAETTRARLLYETQLPTRFYLPREDIRADLRPSPRRTYCPFKGEASYWSVLDLDNIAWSYEQPRPDAAAVAGLVAFWDHRRLEVYLDGERRPKPGGEITAALHDEFSG
jgi:uncharacterized protein (DUF427 family)